jgi:hypothetical protein
MQKSWWTGAHVKQLIAAIVLAFNCIAPSAASAQCETQFVPPKRFPYYCNTSPQGVIDPACQRQAQQEYDAQVAQARQNWQIQVAQCQAREEDAKRQAAQRAEAERQRAAAAEAERQRAAVEAQRAAQQSQTPPAQPLSTQTVTPSPVTRLSNADIERNNRPTVIVVFLVAVTIAALWFFRHSIRFAIVDSRNRQKLEAASKAAAEANKHLDEIREAARAELPVVQSMTASVQVNDKSVLLQIALSQAEQATVDTRGLAQFVLYSEPEWTSDRIENMIAYLRQPVEGVSLFTESDLDARRRELRSMKKNILLGDFLDPLFRKYFDDHSEAAAYSEKLKSEILPQIKKVIYGSMSPAGNVETFEV